MSLFRTLKKGLMSTFLLSYFPTFRLSRTKRHGFCLANADAGLLPLCSYYD